MLYDEKILSQLNHKQLVEVVNKIMISALPIKESKKGIITSVLNHQKIFGDSEVVEASTLKIDDHILQPMQAPLFQTETKAGWCKILRCHQVDATNNDIVNFFKTSNAFINNIPHIELVNKISNKMIQLETISTSAAGNTTINCQCVVRAKVLPSFKFVRKIFHEYDYPPF